MEETSHTSDSKAIRTPLKDASNRINNCHTPTTGRELLREEYVLTSPVLMSIIDSPLLPRNNGENHCPPPVADSRAGSKRNSAVSAASVISAKGKRKTHVGPWQLGRTLGSGATGRVRLAKHAVTGQKAAIKIVSKKCAAISQSDSIAAMNKSAGNFIESGARQMPSGIEREVVIMKLIEHPNVISLYDVWENRGELYLVLEYVEGGELFDYVSNHGPLPEEEAVRLFRQIIAGLGYCHRFNICHRDLKPENILLDGEHNIKLADFGMAALQPAGHWLNTSCGSPHYAAPEIINGRKYRGDRADLWSCGVILYALLAGFLPFDGGDFHTTLQLVRKGDYMIPSNVSAEAADLIQRILQKKPDDRISMKDIWKHPLLKKYEKFHQAICNHYLGPPPPLSPQDCGPPVVRQDIDVDLLRNLQTLWHDVKPEQLIEKLISLEPTQERLFYYALSLRYSASDYHHISRGQARLSKHLRGRSRNGSRRRSRPSSVKETGKRRPSTKEPKSLATVENKSPQFAHITIHRDAPQTSPKPAEVEVDSSNPFLAEEQEIDCQQSPSFTLVRKRKQKFNSVKSSQALNSVSAPRSVSYRRNVTFRHNRNLSQSSASVKAQRTHCNRQTSEGSLISGINDDPFSDPRSSPMLPVQPTVVRGAGIAIKHSAQRRVQHSDFIWRDEARKVSHELSQICEEAFNGSSLSPGCTDTTCLSPEAPATFVLLADPRNLDHQMDGSSSTAANQPADSPKTSHARRELEDTRRRLIEHSTKDGSKDIPKYLAPVIDHLDRLIEQEKTRRPGKASNEEAHGSMSGLLSRSSVELTQLSLLSEELNTADKADAMTASNKDRQVSGSTAASSHRSDISRGKRSIWMVPHSSFQSIGNTGLLTVSRSGAAVDDGPENDESKVLSSQIACNFRDSQLPCELDPIDEHSASPRRSVRSSDRKKWSWFRKPQSIEEDSVKAPRILKPLSPSSATVIVHEVHYATDNGEDHPKIRKPPSDSQKISFWSFMKRKTSKNADPESTATNSLPESHQHYEQQQLRPESKQQEKKKVPQPRRSVRSSNKTDNWFARVFQFKPATRVVALNTSKIEGRKEIYRLLREWKQYGIEYIHLDKPNSIIYGRIGESNFLRLRPVEFSADFYTVIEDGRQANLSVVRFKQERGAASSFNKVVDTLCMVMKKRGLLVEDPMRAKSMALVLDAFPNA
ncbi:hypothetical protein BDW66DRAFT_165289 [Aspergillus desertorum]